MSIPRIMLDGVEIVLHSGAPTESLEPISGGSSVRRMSDGAAVKQTHWLKMGGTISGQGWMPSGIEGLDYSLPLELRLTKVQAMAGAGLSYTLTGTPRPDVPAWGLALVGRDWVRTACSLVDGVAVLAEVAGATQYRACWMPVFSVFCARPTETQDSSGNTHSWQLNWEEV